MDDEITEKLSDAVAVGDDKRVSELIAISMADPDAEDDPGWPAAVLGDLADAYAKHGRYAEAIDAAKRSLEYDDDDEVAVHIDIARYTAQSGDIAQAQALLDDLEREFGDDEFLYWCGAQVWIDLREHQRALALLDRGARLMLDGRIEDHHLTTILEQRARTLGALDRDDDALQYELRRSTRAG